MGPERRRAQPTWSASLTLWAEARARFGRGGPYLFGTFCAADIIYAPVVSRFLTYGIGVPGFAVAYMEAIWTHEWMQAWIDAAEDEEWVIEQFDTGTKRNRD